MPAPGIAAWPRAASGCASFRSADSIAGSRARKERLKGTVSLVLKGLVEFFHQALQRLAAQAPILGRIGLLQRSLRCPALPVELAGECVGAPEVVEVSYLAPVHQHLHGLALQCAHLDNREHWRITHWLF